MCLDVWDLLILVLLIRDAGAVVSLRLAGLFAPRWDHREILRSLSFYVGELDVLPPLFSSAAPLFSPLPLLFPFGDGDILLLPSPEVRPRLDHDEDREEGHGGRRRDRQAYGEVPHCGGVATLLRRGTLANRRITWDVRRGV